MLQNIKKYYQVPLYRNAIAMILNNGSGAFFGLVFWIIAARFMSREDIGFSTSAISLVTLITFIAGFGMDSGMMRFLNSAENKNAFYSTTMTITVLFSVIFSVIYLLLAGFVTPSMSFLQHGWLPVLYLGYTLLSAACYIQNVTLMSLRRSELFFIQNLILSFRIPLFILIAHLGITGVLISLDVTYIISFVFGAYILLRYGMSPKPRINLKSIDGTLGFSFGNYLAGALSIIPTSIIPIIIVGTIGPEQCAYYYVAYSIAAILFFIPQGVSQSLFVEGMYNMPLRENAIKSLKLTLALLIPLVLLIYLFGDTLLSIYSKDFAVHSLSILQLLALSSLFSIVFAIYVSIKKIRNEIKGLILIVGVISVLLIGLSYILMQSHGLMGLGYAWTITYMLVFAFVMFDLYLHYGNRSSMRLNMQMILSFISRSFDRVK